MSAMPSHIITDATKSKISAALKGRTARTPEQLAKLRRMWDEGLSTAEMGRQMGGWSKSVVQGLCHRQGFPPRPSPIDRSGVGLKIRMTRGPIVALSMLLDRTERDPGTNFLSRNRPTKPVPLFFGDASIGCQFVTDATRNKQRFCDAPRRAGRAYCPAHHAICYVQPAAKDAAA